MDCILNTVQAIGAIVFALPLAILATPFCLIFDFFTISHPDLFRPTNNAARHREKVEKVQSQVREWIRKGRKKPMCTARPGWQTLSATTLNKNRFTKIKINLEDIIEIDTKNMVLRVEPGMKMGTLTRKLLPLGWTIPVIPEFETLTIGGCVCGTGIESSSHKYGLFADSCVEFELVLPDGSITTCSRDLNPDLFHTISWSHGTLGFLTAVTIPIRRAGKYVRLEYHPTESITTAQILLNESEENDFVEGIAYSLHDIVVMHGKVVDEPVPKKQVNHINRWYKPFFYRHVESMLKNGSPTVEYIPLRDYYHRHQRAYFWEVELGFIVSNFWLFRYLFGWIFPMNFQLGKLLAPGCLIKLGLHVMHHVLQDFMVPISSLKDVLQLSHEEVKIYPLWLCPCKFCHTPGIAPLPDDSDEMYIDIGIYENPPRSINFNAKHKIRKFEKFTTEVNGYQFLYADTYMTREEFGKMFKLDNYNKIREKYKCIGAFPEIYDKVSRSARN